MAPYKNDTWKKSTWNRKYDTPKNGALQKWHTSQKNTQSLPYLLSTEMSDF